MKHPQEQRHRSGERTTAGDEALGDGSSVDGDEDAFVSPTMTPMSAATKISSALINKDMPCLGVIDLPFHNSRYSAAEGHGAHFNDRQIHTSQIGDLGSAVVAIGDYAMGSDAAEKNRLRLPLTHELAARVQRVRSSARPRSIWPGLPKAESTPTSCSATSPGTPPPESSSPAKPEPSWSTWAAARTP
nr:inositol monophosphatase family protein [Streptosporangium canum]